MCHASMVQWLPEFDSAGPGQRGRCVAWPCSDIPGARAALSLVGVDPYWPLIGGSPRGYLVTEVSAFHWWQCCHDSTVVATTSWAPESWRCHGDRLPVSQYKHQLETQDRRRDIGDNQRRGGGRNIPEWRRAGGRGRDLKCFLERDYLTPGLSGVATHAQRFVVIVVVTPGCQDTGRAQPNYCP